MTMENAILQSSFEFGTMSEGSAIMVMGVVAILLYASIQFSNPFAGIACGLSVMMLVLSEVLELGAELFWLSVVGTITILIAGLAVRIRVGGSL